MRRQQQRRGIADAMDKETVDFGDISKANFRIRGTVKNTECLRSDRLSEQLGCNIFFKNEFNQRTGSFKERGARNVLAQLSAEQREKGVIAASAGNHALAVSYHGQQLGIPVTVVMPDVAPLTKVTNCRKLGANVVVQGQHLLESREFADQLAAEHDLYYINGYDDHGIIAGQGTIGLEVLQQVPDMDAIIVPIGGGGLIAGISVAIKALRPDVEIIGVEPEACASWAAAVEAGEAVPVSMGAGGTLADGLAVTCVGPRSFSVARDLIDTLVQVPESVLALSVLRLLEMDRVVVEGGGAAGLAGLLHDHSLRERLRGKTVVAVLCGGNIDMPVLGRVIERGLAADGRIHRFVASVSDRPGGINGLTKVVAECGASVKDIHHERAWLHSDVHAVMVKMVVETRDEGHAMELRELLTENGYQYQWGKGSSHFV